jgi:hypothetical protein
MTKIIKIFKRKKIVSLICAVAVLISSFSTISFASNPPNLPAGVMKVFYVSPLGNDTNSGISSATPFKTISKAKTEVAKVNSNMTGDINVYLMGGLYSQDTTLKFTPTDSGTNGYKVVYKNYDDKTPIISGGKQVTGWEKASNNPNNSNTYRAYIGDNPAFQNKYFTDDLSGNVLSWNYVNANSPQVPLVAQLDTPIAISADSFYNKVYSFDKQTTGTVTCVVTASAAVANAQLLFDLVSDQYQASSSPQNQYYENSAGGIYFAGDSYLRYLDKTSPTNYVGFKLFNPNQKYTFKIVADLDTKTISYYVDGALIASRVGFWSSINNIAGFRTYTTWQKGAYNIYYYSVTSSNNPSTPLATSGGSRVLSFSPVDSNYVTTEKNFTPQTQNISLELSATPSQTNSELRLKLSDDNYNDAIMLTFAPNGKIRAYSTASNYTELADYAKDKSYNFKIDANIATKTYNVTINGTTYSNIAFMTGSTATSISKLVMSAGSAMGSFTVSNIKLTNTTTSQVVFGPLIEGNVGEIATGYLPNPGNAVVTSLSGNKVMMLSCDSTSSERYASAAYRQFETMTGYSTVEGKVQAAQTTSSLFVDVKNRMASSAAKLEFAADGNIKAYVGTTATTIMSYQKDKMYSLKFVFDFQNKKYDLYIDNLKKGSFNFSDSSTKNVDRFQLSTYQAGTFYTDDIGVTGVIKSRDLYVNGQSAQIAKTESTPDGFVCDYNFGFNLPNSGYFANMANWQNVNDIEMNQVAVWAFPWGSVDYIENGKIYMKQPFFHDTLRYSPPLGPWGSGMTYPETILNAFELLDKPGEWYQNRSDGYIYYIPKSGEDMSTADVILGTLDTGILSVQGTAVNPVKNISFDGIQFSYNNWLQPATPEGIPTSQGGMSFKSALVFNFSKNIDIINCKMQNIGTNGIKLDGGCQDFNINNNIFKNIATDAIDLIGPHASSNDALLTKNINIMHNDISYSGSEFSSSVSVNIGYTSNTIIENNTIHDLPYTAISMGLGHGADDEVEDSMAGNNSIRYNRIFNSSLICHDSGCIYLLGEQKGTVIQYNYVRLNQNRPGTRSENAIYLDNGTEYVTVRDNVLESLNGSGSVFSSNWLPDAWGLGAAGEYMQTHYNSFFDNYYTSSLKYALVAPTTYVGQDIAVDGNNYNSRATQIINNSGRDGSSIFESTISVINNRDSSVSYSDLWTVASKTGSLDIMPTPTSLLDSYNMNLKYSNKVGAGVETQFTGKKIKVFIKRSQYGGDFDVFIDGKYVDTASSYSQNDKVNVLAYENNTLALCKHTIRLVIKTGSLFFDRFEVNTDADIPFYYVNDNADNITYGGSGWQYIKRNTYGEYKNDAHETSTYGDYVQYTFNGTGVDFVTNRLNDRGPVDVYIDGAKKVTVNCYDDNSWANGLILLPMQSMYSITGLNNGQHTIKVVNASSAIMDVDAFKVYTTNVTSTGEYRILLGSRTLTSLDKVVDVNVDEGIQTLANPKILIQYTFKNGTIGKVIIEYSKDISVNLPNNNITKVEVFIVDNINTSSPDVVTSAVIS